VVNKLGQVKSALHKRRLRAIRRARARRSGLDAYEENGLDHTPEPAQPAPGKPAPLLISHPLQKAQRVALARTIGYTRGNRSLRKIAARLDAGRVSTRARGGETSSSTAVQMDGGKKQGMKKTAANPGGRGPGRIQNAAEVPYDVGGVTLSQAGGQLNQFGGFGAQTDAPLGVQNGNAIRPIRLADGTFQARVTWIIAGAQVHLPRWTGYNNACPAAQQEWDRFMAQTRQHEQEAHVNAARDFVNGLGDEDRVITGSSVSDLQSSLTSKQQELGARLQAIHDACDHGVGIDAVLHPDQGSCEETP